MMPDLVHPVLDDYAQGAAGRLGASMHCSIILLRVGTLVSVGSSDARAARCDLIEAEDGVGPCVLAAEQLSSVLIPDLRLDERWGRWRDAAVKAGFRAAAALPAYVDEETTVALNLYSEAVEPWDRGGLLGMDAYVQEIAAAVRARL